MTERTIARRWLRALFELALEAKEADAVAGDLRELDGRLTADGDARALLGDPRASKVLKKETATRLLPAGARPLTTDFVQMAVDRGREEILAVAAEEFLGMLREQRGEALAEVVSAAPLDAEAKTALLMKLEGLTQKKVTLSERVDGTLLGGMRVRVGSTLLDGTVKRRLSELRDDLRHVALPDATT